MFVPEPVISLSIKPAGLETPNFSRALNRFQKEDPTFRVHLDPESKEVRRLSAGRHSRMLNPPRQLSAAWASCTWTSTSSV